LLYRILLEFLPQILEEGNLKGGEMGDFFHDWMVSYLKRKLGRDYKEVKANTGEERHEFRGHYPDLILGSYGMVVALVEVETEETITPEQAERWKELASLGPKLIIMVPAHTKAKVADLLWKTGLGAKASVGTYEIVVKM